MISGNRFAMKPILHSQSGVHLTAYLVNRGNLIDLKAQLRTAINQAYECLSPVISIEERKKFLERLDPLVNDSRVLKQMKGNIGIFRNQEFFRILSLPIEVEQACQVATSFHVKPLLRWLQGDREFLLLYLEKDAAHMYTGNQDSISLLESILLPSSEDDYALLGGYEDLKKARDKKMKLTETLVWLREWVQELAGESKSKLVIAGEDSLVWSFSRALAYKDVLTMPLPRSAGEHDISEAYQAVRKILKKESKEYLENSIQEFKIAARSGRARRDLFQIAEAVIQGRVRKLIVTDEVNIFGKIDRRNGHLAIHPFDLDHEDDCVLDDLAQIVLGQGGEVVIAKMSQIPMGRPILAIIDDDSCSHLEEPEDFQYYEVLEERFG